MRPNYNFKKRQKEEARRRKQEAKRNKKLNKSSPEPGSQDETAPGDAAPGPENAG